MATSSQYACGWQHDTNHSGRRYLCFLGPQKDYGQCVETLRLCNGVLQRGWKEPATGEYTVAGGGSRGPLRGLCSGRYTELLDLVTSGSLRLSAGSDRDSTGANTGVMWKTIVVAATAAPHAKAPTDRSHAELQQFPTGGPMERIGVDVLGPFPRSERGNRYVLTVMDYFTKWPEAYSLPDQEAETIVDALVEGNFQPVRGTWGHPHRPGQELWVPYICDHVWKAGLPQDTHYTPPPTRATAWASGFNRTLALTNWP